MEPETTTIIKTIAKKPLKKIKKKMSVVTPLKPIAEETEQVEETLPVEEEMFLSNQEKIPHIVKGFIVKGHKYVGLHNDVKPIFIKVTGEYDINKPSGWQIDIYEPVAITDEKGAMHYYPQWVSKETGWLMERDMYNILLFDETRDYFRQMH